MFFKYGTHRHPDNEVNLVTFRQDAVRNARGLVQFTRKTLSIEGVLLASTQATIKTAIAAMETAYAVDGKDAALFHDDGTKSPHSLDSNDSIGGVRVRSISFDKATAAEYATQRTFRVTLWADFAGQDNLVQFIESLRFVGTGGPKRVWVQLINGLAQRQQVQARTTQRIVQSGTAIGYVVSPAFPTPIFPQYEHEDRREANIGSPQRDGDDHINYPISWTYHFEAPVALSGRPNAR